MKVWTRTALIGALALGACNNAPIQEGPPIQEGELLAEGGPDVVGDFFGVRECDLLLHRYQSGDVESAGAGWPTCAPMDEAWDGFSSLLVPVMVVAADVEADAATAERIAQSMMRIQGWMRSETGVSVDVDRVMRIDARNALADLTSEGTFDARTIAGLMEDRVGAVLQARRSFVVFVLGAGGEPVQLRDRIHATRNLTILPGTAVEALPEACFESDGAAPCDYVIQTADALLAEAALHVMLPEAASEIIGENFAFGSIDTAALSDELAESALARQSSVLESGHLHISDDVEYVQAIAASPDKVAVVWESPTGLGDSDALGYQNTTLKAALIDINDNSVSVAVDVSESSPEADDEGELWLRTTKGAAVVFDAPRNRFAVVYRVVRPNPPGSNYPDYPLRLRFIDASTGALSDVQELVVNEDGGGRQVLRAAYHDSTIYMTWGSSRRDWNRGGLVFAGTVDLSTPTPTLNHQLVAARGRVGDVAVDSRRGRALVAWTEHVGDVSVELAGTFLTHGGVVNPDGTPAAGLSRLDISTGRGRSYGRVAFDSVRDQFRVAMWGNGDGAYADILSFVVNAPDGVASEEISLSGDELSYDNAPDIAHMPTPNSMLVAYPSSQVSFGGISRVSGQILNGSRPGELVGVHQSHDAFPRVVAASHPTRALAFILRSGLGGVDLEFVHVETSSYVETENCIDEDGGTEVLRPGTVGSVRITVPPGAVPENECVNFYVDRGRPLTETNGTPVGDPIRVGIVQRNVYLTMPVRLTVTPPAANAVVAPTTNAERIATEVQCWNHRNVSFGNVSFEAGAYAFDYEQNATCQLLHFPLIEEEVVAIDNNASDLGAACGSMFDAGLGRNYNGSSLYFTNSFEASGTTFEGGYFTLHSIYDVWNMQSASMSSWETTRTLVDVSADVSGLVGFAAAATIAEEGEETTWGVWSNNGTDDILRAWHGRTQHTIGFDLEIATLMPINIGTGVDINGRFRYFGMYEGALTGNPVMFGAQIGVGFSIDMSPPILHYLVGDLEEILDEQPNRTEVRWFANDRGTIRHISRARRVNDPNYPSIPSPIGQMPGSSVGTAPHLRVGYGYADNAEPLEGFSWADRGRMMGYSLASLKGLKRSNFLSRRVGRLTAALGRARDEMEATGLSLERVCCRRSLHMTARSRGGDNPVATSDTVSYCEAPQASVPGHEGIGVPIRAECERHPQYDIYRAVVMGGGALRTQRGDWVGAGCSVATTSTLGRQVGRAYCCDSASELPDWE